MPVRSRHRRRFPLAAGLGLAALAAMAAMVAAAAALSGSPARPPSGSAPGVPPSLSRPPTTGSDSRVPSRAAGTTVSTAGWRAVMADGAPVPVSPAGGPARQGGGLVSGFTDTPAGAVLAAVNIAVRTSGQAGSAVFTATIARQVTGPGAQALLSAAWTEYDQAAARHRPQSSGGPAGPATATVTSFDLTAWSPSQASVTLTAAASASHGEQVAIPLGLQWLDGDWRLVAPAGGSFPAVPAAAPVPPGYTPLPGR